MAASTSDGGSVKQSNNSTSEDTEPSTEEFCPGFKDVDAFVKHGLGAVVAATKASACLPQAGDEFDFYRSFPGFQDFCAIQGDRLLQTMSQLMQHYGCSSLMKDRNKLTGLEDRFDLVVESNDVVLEKVGIMLDEASGMNRSQPVMPTGYQPPKIVVSSWNRKVRGRGAQTFCLLQAKNIQRPQLKFKEKVDNSNTPFVSKIFIKPNATKPLPSCEPEDLDVPAALADFIHQLRTQEHMDDMFSHPYQYELDHLVMPQHLGHKPEPQMYKPLAETSCKFIDTLEDLVALNEKLAKTTEFAVDLEHHSYRSFLGITCLMQISTREEDFIIDALELRSEMNVLNESFTDPTIIKVFHGADLDIEWLQKDFGVYVVNMFDTHQAARSLNLGRNSLDHLLKVFCDVDSNKRYQLADWRIRPLPGEMLQYAQADTHYLLYVYDRLRADLFDAANGQPSLVQVVWSKSKDLCLKKYVKPIFTEDSYMELYRKQKKSFNSQQLMAFRLLYSWRDKMAREEDESTGYVLPNHMMMKIAEELPKEPQGIVACCNPTPPLVRQQLNELHQLIKQAREIPLLKVSHAERSESTLFGPHDTSHVSESGFIELSSHGRSRHVLQTPDITFYLTILVSGEDADNSGHLTVAQQKARNITDSFENPFRMVRNLTSDDIHISKNAKYDPSSKIYEISNQWKLQSLEQQQKEAQAKRQAHEQPLSCDFCHQEAKQGQKRERIASEAREVTPKPNKVMKREETPIASNKQSEDSNPSTAFTPYDYSQSNFKVFTGGKSKDSAQFDPNRQTHERSRKVMFTTCHMLHPHTGPL
uniref:Exosome complex component 10 n=1 Tax=Electrophorus electricus TaxID=8005 RepID=A0A4W4GXM6_ELEEL